MRNEKQNEVLQDALQYLDDEMIEDVENLRGFVEKKKPVAWKKWTALAASICVCVIGGWIYGVYVQPAEDGEKFSNAQMEYVEADQDEESKQSDEESLKQHNSVLDDIGNQESVAEEMPLAQQSVNTESYRGGVQIPQMEFSLNKTEGIEADMLGFFILNGSSYIQYEFQHNYEEVGADFVGEYVGHITGTINEWTEADSYVDGTGTYTGEVYKVKGISPEFMLCMVWEDGSVETFIHNNDITLYKGANLVDDWLDLRKKYDAVAFETVVNHQFTYEPLELTKEEREVFDRFLDAFAKGDFVYNEEKLTHPFGGDMDTPDMFDFYFIKENGVRLRFRTLGDGYVSFPWLNACIQIEQEVYDAVVDILQQQAN